MSPEIAFILLACLTAIAILMGCYYRGKLLGTEIGVMMLKEYNRRLEERLADRKRVTELEERLAETEYCRQNAVTLFESMIGERDELRERLKAALVAVPVGEKAPIFTMRIFDYFRLQDEDPTDIWHGRENAYSRLGREEIVSFAPDTNVQRVKLVPAKDLP